MALQTREQHIRREKATSNICTAQVLLAVIAGMYAVYHGPRGLRAIAERVAGLAALLAHGLERLGVRVKHRVFFDTVRVDGSAADVARWIAAAEARRINLRRLSDTALAVALDETTTRANVEGVAADLLCREAVPAPAVAPGAAPWAAHARQSAYLKHPVFNTHHSETEMLRYMRRLEARDLSLTHAMIPLGSCTMKLNATVEMMPVTWPEWGKLHPFAPPEQTRATARSSPASRKMLCVDHGFAATSLQPNAGSQGDTPACS
jgi:glycine dehydrogenase